MRSFYLTLSGTVLSQWIDRNGHMNVAAYMALFDQGTFILLDSCGFGIPGNDLTMVAARILIDHRKELMEGEKWELWSGVVFADPKCLTVTHRLRSATSLRAVCDIRGTPFSMRTRTAISLDNEALKNISKWIVPGLIDRFNLNIVSTNSE